MAASSEYRVNIIISSKDQTSAAAKAAGGSMQGLAQNVLSAAAAYVSLKGAQEAIKFVKLGADVEAATNRFYQFSGGVEQGTIYLDALMRASDGAIDKMGAMSSGAKLIQMGLVDDAASMELVTAAAVKLGDQTKSATDRMSDFALMLANQSILRLDNFGISSGKVRARIEELQKETAGLTREQAFLQATLEQARISLAKLGDTSELAKTKLDIVGASFATIKQNMALVVTQSAPVNAALSDTAGWWKNLAILTDASKRGTEEYTKALEYWQYRYGFLADAGMALYGMETKHQEQLAINERATYLNAMAMSQLATNTQEVAIQYGATDAATLAYLESLGEAMPVYEAFQNTSSGIKAVLEEQRLAAADLAIAYNDMVMQLKDASQAQIAQVAMGQLAEMLQDGTITQKEYATATNEVMLAFGLATPESIALHEKMIYLNNSLAEGKIDAENYADALGILSSQGTTARDTVREFAASINEIPDYKEILIRTVITGGTAEYVPGAGYTGNTTNVDNRATNTTNNWNVNDPAAAAAIAEQARRERVDDFTRRAGM